jgi:hypothetical protein
MVGRTAWRFLCCLLLVTVVANPPHTFAQDVRVTVIAIMASDKNEPIDPKLKDVAKEIQKREPGLTSFRLQKTEVRDINVGQKESIVLLENNGHSADVKLIAKDDSKKRVTIEVKPPMVGAITYATVYDKFFPIVTRAVVNGERLIIAVMVKPGK